MNEPQHAPSQGCVRWWMRNHTNFPAHFEVIEREYRKQLASTLADKFKKGKPNETDE